MPKSFVHGVTIEENTRQLPQMHSINQSKGQSKCHAIATSRTLESPLLVAVLMEEKGDAGRSRWLSPPCVVRLQDGGRRGCKSSMVQSAWSKGQRVKGSKGQRVKVEDGIEGFRLSFRDSEELNAMMK